MKISNLFYLLEHVLTAMFLHFTLKSLGGTHGYFPYITFFFLFPSLTMLLLWLNDNIEIYFKDIAEYNILKQCQLPVLIHFKHILLN